MTISIKEKKVYKCVLCGAETDWDDDLGPEPLCVNCWDIRAGIDNEIAAKKRIKTPGPFHTQNPETKTPE